MQIDAHHHLWRPERGDYHWMRPDDAVLCQSYEPRDLQPLLDRFGISRTILVQAACTDEETQFLLAQAQRFPAVAGVVGWVDFTHPEAPARIAQLAQDQIICGLRPMVQDIADDEWLLRHDLAPAMAAMVEHRLVFDALTYPRHLSQLRRFIDRYPDLAVVVDHASKPDIAHGGLDPWRQQIASIAADGRTCCKISGLVTEAAPDWTVDDLRPFVDHLLTCFGASRLMWGSDWPVLNLAGGYTRWREAAETLLSGLDPVDRDAVFGGTAQRVYLQRKD